MSYFLNKCEISEFRFSVPLSVTRTDGQPKYGRYLSMMVELTDSLDLVLTGLAITKPVAASTRVQIAM